MWRVRPRLLVLVHLADELLRLRKQRRRMLLHKPDTLLSEDEQCPVSRRTGPALTPPHAQGASRAEKTLPASVPLVLVVLLGVVVAVASSGRAWAGTTRESGWSGQTVLYVMLAGVGIGWLLVVARLRHEGAGGLVAGMAGVSLLTLGALAASLLAVGFLWSHLEPPTGKLCPGCTGRAPFIAHPHFFGRPVPGRGGGSLTAGHGRSGSVPLAWVLGAGGAAVALAAAVAMRSARRRSSGSFPAAGPRDPADRFVEESLDDLRREPDVRRAVEACYARMERLLARLDLQRGQAEAPYEYLDRVVRSLHLSGRGLERLTHLFEEVKFSPHAATERMRDEAIAALTALRSDAVSAS